MITLFPGLCRFALSRRSLSSLAAVMIFAAWTSAASGQTVVSLTFDDGQATQYSVRDALNSRGMRATFYINSGNVPTSPGWYMSWTQIAALAADGHEIGGHTLTHPNLTQVSYEEQVRQICEDRQNLINRGFKATSFAYPYGASNTSVKDIVRNCGYTSARGAWGIQCSGCVKAETLPPADAYWIRVQSGTFGPDALNKLKSLVLTAEQTGGWLPLMFHEICSGCGWDPVSLTDFNAFLDWLKTREAHGTVVKTVGAVTNPPSAPLPPPPPPPPPPVQCAAFKAEYFAGTTLSGTPIVTRCEDTIQFDWGLGSPHPDVPVDNFSGRFTGSFNAPSNGSYTFSIRTNDGVRLRVGGQLVLDKWFAQLASYTVTLSLAAGAHPVVIEHYEGTGTALLTYSVSGPTASSPPADITPPTVTSVSPVDGATGVATSTSVSVSFSEAMDKVSVQGAFSLVASGSATAVTGTFSWSGDRMTFQPAQSLFASHQYRATVGTGARDAAGNGVTAATTWSFTVASPPPVDTTPPVVAITSPAEGATVTGTIAVTATASDASGIRQVVFFVDGKQLGTSTSAPYRVNWNTRKWSKGPHVVHAVATDHAGSTATSAAVPVTVR